jgi:parallel beta-helix repeat protein
VFKFILHSEQKVLYICAVSRYNYENLWRCEMKKLIFTFLCLFLAGSSYAEIIVVDDDGPANFTLIQDAINAAGAGDTIRVMSGTYTENIDVNKPLHLMGENPNNTIVDGGGVGNVITITANNAIVRNFTITNSATSYYAILCQSHRNNIIRNKITNEYGYGIKLDGSNRSNIIANDVNSNGWEGISVSGSSGTLISKNMIASNADYGAFGIVIYNSDNTMVLNNTLVSNEGGGIHIKENSHHNTIRGNYISESTGSGIVIGADICSNEPTYNIIIRNDVNSNSYNGIELIETTDNTITENRIIGNGLNGITIADASFNTIENNIIKDHNSGSNCFGICFVLSSLSHDVTIKGNEISENYHGISIADSYHCLISDNTIAFNQISGIIMNWYPTNDNTVCRNKITGNKYGIGVAGLNNKIYHNIFADNTISNAESQVQHNWWDDNAVSGPRGNFWDDYDGNDTNNDGVGETSYVIGLNNEDRYPLIMVSHKITTDQTMNWPLPWPEMGKPYKLIIDLTNNMPEDITFTGVEQTGVYPSYRPWGLGFNIEQCTLPDPCVIDANGGTTHTELEFNNDWYWIEPHDWANVIVNLVLGEINTGCSIVSFIQACYEVGQAVPEMTYIFEPLASSRPYVNFSTDVTIHVPYEKQMALYTSFELEAASIISALNSIFAGPYAPAFSALSIGYSIGSVVLYNAAVDPNESYTEIFEPQTIAVPEVDTLPEGMEKRMALAALDFAALEQAYEQSYIRYDAARLADANEYMEMQLGAALKYKAMAAEKLNEMQFLTAVVTENMPTLTDNDINNFRETISRDGLPKIHEDVLEQMGLASEKLSIRQVILDVTDPTKITPQQWNLYKDPNNLIEYQNTVNQGQYVENYALQLAAETKELTVQPPNDVAITDLWPSTTEVEVGNNVNIHVEVENRGDENIAILDINAFAGSFGLGPNTVYNLASGTKQELIFEWDANTIGFYTIRAEVVTDINDGFSADNTFFGDTVKVWDSCDVTLRMKM